MKRHISVLLLVLILAIGTAVRFIGLGGIPPGLTDDEADKGYDAYSLQLTGKDQWGAPWPLLAFKGFGDYRASLYTYLAIPTVKLFGLTPFAVRFPSAFFGTLSILAVYILVVELFRGLKHARALAIISAALLAISPWHIGMSRMAMEVTVSVFLVMIGVYLFLSGQRHRLLVPLSGLVFALSVYAYPANIVFVPIVMMLLIGFFRESYIKKQLPLTILAVALFFSIALPVVIAGNTATSVRVRQVNLTNDSGIIDLLNEKRGACLQHVPAPICRVVFNKYYAFFEKFVDNYINHFSVNLLGIYGTSTQYSVLPERGLLYVIELPLLLLGVHTAFRTKSKPGIFMTLWLLVSAIPDSITSDGHYVRFLISLPAWQVLISVGLLQLTQFDKKKFFLLSVICLLLVADISHFAFEYTTYFPYRYSRFSHYGYKELIADIENYKYRYDKIIVSSSVNDAKQYIFYLFHIIYDPLMFQKGIGVEKELDRLGWVRVKRIQSVYFVPDLPLITKQTVIKDRELFIGDPSEFPKKVYIPTQFVVKDKKGDVVFQAVDAKDYIRCIQVVCTPDAAE
jgi:4-amino-4-deoxy-L-arabinose transferase-like glycosyltransferase